MGAFIQNLFNFLQHDRVLVEVLLEEIIKLGDEADRDFKAHILGKPSKKKDNTELDAATKMDVNRHKMFKSWHEVGRYVAALRSQASEMLMDNKWTSSTPKVNRRSIRDEFLRGR